MASNQQMQRSRYEMKYIIDEVTARGIRDFARSYLQRDKYALPSMRYAYPVFSLYLDGPGLMLYNATVQGQLNRYKLRLRYYKADSSSPVFFEIKRRLNDVILKDRALVHHDAAAGLLAGRRPRPEDLVNPDDVDAYGSLRRFTEMRHNIQAVPRVVVHYEREAWVTARDNSVRLTFDRRIAAAAWEGHLFPETWRYPRIDGVVLELKFDNRFPFWMRDLVRSFNLYRTSMAKYVRCTEAMPPQETLVRQLVGSHL